MTRARGIEVLALALAIAAGTWFGAWWAVPVLAALWQLIRPGQSAWMAGLGAGLAWWALLALHPWLPLGRLTTRVGGIFHLPPGALLALAVGYAWLLAWSAARLVRPVRG